VAIRIAVPRETREGETRVALVPESVKRLLGAAAKQAGDDENPLTIAVEAGAGERAFAADDAYRDAGAQIGSDPDALWSGADLVVCVNPPEADRISLMRQGAALLGLLLPTQHADLARACREQGVSALSFDALPRVTRAQKMDVLSSMSTIAGYRAALIGAVEAPRMFPMLMTAAGTITPCKALVIGAGVAGLQAVATARRLGAVVEAYDVRAAAKEQVLSLGARFVELEDQAPDAETAGGYAKEQTEAEQRRQRELLADHIAEADVVITTALVPGKPAPKIVDESNVARMKPGAVIVDLAADAGGNCTLTEPGQRIERNGVAIVGPLNLPASVPAHASLMFSRNAAAFVSDLLQDGDLRIDLDDEVVRGALITHEGEVLHAPTREALGLPPLAPAQTASETA